MKINVIHIFLKFQIYRMLISGRNYDNIDFLKWSDLQISDQSILPVNRFLCNLAHTWNKRCPFKRVKNILVGCPKSVRNLINSFRTLISDTFRTPNQNILYTLKKSIFYSMYVPNCIKICSQEVLIDHWFVNPIT